MGYFANGTEGESFQDRYCFNCVHWKEGADFCPVWAMHLDYNYDREPTVRSRDGAFVETLGDILDRFIRRERRTGARWTQQECVLYHPRSKEAELEAEGQGSLFAA